MLTKIYKNHISPIFLLFKILGCYISPTDINLHLDPPKYDQIQRHPRVQYTSNLALGYEGTHYSRHLSTLSARLAVHRLELPMS
jgi:hypothetical protein